MFWRPPARSRLSYGMQWSRQAYRAAAWIHTVLAVIMLAVAWNIPFGEKTDFDIIGFLFLVTSIPAMAAWVTFLGFALCAAYCWARSLSASDRREDPWS